MKSLLFIVLFFAANLVRAQIYYPVNKDGKWGLMDEEGNEVLAPTYDFISYQWIGDKFIFDKRGKFGVLHPDGRMLCEAEFDEITYLDTSASARMLNNQWALYYNNEQKSEFLYDSINYVVRNVYALYKKDNFRLFIGKTEQLSESFYLEWHQYYDLLKAQKADKSGFDLFDKNDLSIVVPNFKNLKVDYARNMMRIIYEDGFQIFDPIEKTFVTERYDEIDFQFQDWYLCTIDTSTFMFDLKTRKKYQIPFCEDLVDVEGSLCVFRKDRKYGVYNYKTGKMVMVPKYSGLAIKRGMIYTNEGGKYGLSNKSGREIFPPIYENIAEYDRFYVVTKNGKNGIASKSGRILEEPGYKRIEIFDQNVKCYEGKTLTTFNIDGAGNLKDKTTYETYMSVNFTKSKRPVERARNLNFSGSNSGGFDGFGKKKDVNKYGWFQQEIEKTVDDSTFTVYGLWGLKDKDDSLRIRHMYGEIDIYNERLTLCYRGKKIDRFGSTESLQKALGRKLMYQIGQCVGFDDGKFMFVNHLDYIRMSNYQFMNIKFQDWEKYALARGMTDKPVLVDTNFRVIYEGLTYYSKYYREDMLRVCIGGEYETHEYSKNMGRLMFASDILSNFGLRHMTYLNKRGKMIEDVDFEKDEIEPLVEIKGGGWHFIDKYGNLKNEEPFQYAYEFFNGRCVVQKNNKWGVIDTAMNVIVPIEYASVQTLYVNGKVYYKVWKPNKQLYYYNRARSVYSPTDVNPNKLEHYHQGKWHYQGRILDSNLTDLGPAQYEYISGGFGKFQFAKTGENFTLMDENGKLLNKEYETNEVWPIGHGRYIQKNGGSSFALVDQSGTYLIPKYIGYKLIANTENFIFYLDYNLKFKYWSKNNIPMPKKVEVLSGNPELGLLLCQKGKKKFLYNFNTQEIDKETDVEMVKSLVANGMIYQDVNRYDRLGMVSYKGDTIFKGTYWNIDYNGRDWAIAKINSDAYRIIDNAGQFIYQDTFISISQIQNRKDLYIVRTSSGVGVIDDQAKIVLPFDYSTISLYEPDVFKVTKRSDNKIYYLFENGDVKWEVEHSTTKGFPPNGYIKVVGRKPRRKGTSYFYDGYLNKSMPFPDIYPVSSNTFILEESRVEGVYSYEGDTIVPVEYHVVHPVRGKFQVRFFNSFGYINEDQTKMFDPRIIE